jgi:regulatory protein
MKIEKYVKSKQNKYKVTIDHEEYELYDDVIIEFNLLMKDSIDDITFNKMINVNDELESYYDSIKYITKKLRCEKEIHDYLIKKGISLNLINKTIKKLKDNNFLNEDIYIKSYINDQINLTNNGYKKIKSNLLKLNLNELKIDEYLSLIDPTIWDEKIDNYISKKIKNNHSSSSYMLKIKITNDLVNLGYEKDKISDILSKYDIIDKDILKKEIEKATRELSKKYSGYELEQHVRARLYRKGFSYNIEESSNEK